MFLLKVKGRGFYNGHRIDYYWKDRVTTYCSHEPDQILKIEILYKFKAKFKRDSSDVDSVFAFNTKEEAENFLKERKEILKTWIDRGNWTEKRNNHRWVKQAMGYTEIKYKYDEINIIDTTPLKKVYDAIEVVESDDYIELKKISRLNLKHEMQIEETNSHYDCDCCRMNFADGEPSMVFTKGYKTVIRVCFNCIKSKIDDFEKEYKKNPRYESITSSWMLEMTSNTI